VRNRHAHGATESQVVSFGHRLVASQQRSDQLVRDIRGQLPTAVLSS
jgi:hypothetical protein